MKKKRFLRVRANRRPTSLRKKKIIRPRKKPSRVARRKSIQTTSSPLRMAKIDAALARYEKAMLHAQGRAEELAKLAHWIAESAVEKFRVALLGDWAERALLRDIAALRVTFAEHPLGSLPKCIESFRLFPEAILQWLESRFDLQPIGESGKIIEIPAERLNNYSYDFEPPIDLKQLITLRIVSQGWKRHQVLLIPPRVERVDTLKSDEPPC